MNARFSEVKNVDLFASDGPIGKVVDLLIDDKHWMVRYLVVAITDGSSNRTRRILIAPAAISNIDLEGRVIATTLDSTRVKTSPTLDDAQSVSRQHELALAEHYGWSLYWIGQTVLPPQTLERFANDVESTAEHDGDTNLRSAAEICGYQIRSRNGKAGVMSDLVVNLRTWSADNCVAESSSWLPLESSMFLTRHIQALDWSNREITVDLSREVLQPEAPLENPISVFTQAFSARQAAS